MAKVQQPIRGKGFRAFALESFESLGALFALGLRQESWLTWRVSAEPTGLQVYVPLVESGTAWHARNSCVGFEKWRLPN